MNNELSIGSLIYDTEIDDYGIIIDYSWTDKYKPIYKYYLIYWQKSVSYNDSKIKALKWSAAHLHSRIKNGEILVIN